MIIDFTKGNFVVYENKTEKGKDEVETVKYFNDYKGARAHMAKRLLDESYETDTIFGYAPEEVTFLECDRDRLKDCGSLLKHTTTGKTIYVASLFINPDEHFDPYKF